ncbi:peptide ABC transporter substrate-binding protein [Salipaludibacillus keqinensis]|uniref:Peptide ABC transporter substrate-binding protein n=1 Tax=Salipaludibacillus keqinensis TaxID=2045207 RepID=A0A323T4J4_9BACI|nr:dipeptide ABC transporter ATP-binding protein [Salipaludibacillus keqinensis]PYZ91511.1 peptide ABC transporter substrate-binding protein [Salipaludibacillus keqinensis]
MNPNLEDQTNSPEVLLEINKLKKYFPVKGGVLQRTIGHVKAVDEVTFSVYKGETLGIVGESGSGKSTLGRTILRLLDPTDGQIVFKDSDISTIGNRKMRRFRKEMQMIFQDPFASLNPRMSVGEIIEEPMIIQRNLSKKERKEKVVDLLEKVGMSEDTRQKYPHEFSGGQRQRIGIARALTMNPELIIADEPVSALDVSVQSQVLNLMADLQDEFQLTYLFIAHDLSVVKHFSDRVGVMYLGKMAELGPKSVLYQNPLHPYTRALLSSVPVPDMDRKRDKITLYGELPSPSNPPTGCPFHTRCSEVHKRCKEEVPQFIEQEKGHYVACHLYTREDHF